MESNQKTNMFGNIPQNNIISPKDILLRRIRTNNSYSRTKQVWEEVSCQLSQLFL